MNDVRSPEKLVSILDIETSTCFSNRHFTLVYRVTRAAKTRINHPPYISALPLFTLFNCMHVPYLHPTVELYACTNILKPNACEKLSRASSQNSPQFMFLRFGEFFWVPHINLDPQISLLPRIP